MMRPSRDRRSLDAQLAEARRRIAELQDELARQGSRDPVTGVLHTLGAFRTQFELDARRAHRGRQPLSIAILDVDGFRTVNADHGFSVGDEVLATVGRAISTHTRFNDLACRMGADEFAILLVGAAPEAARGAMERLLSELEVIHAGPLHGIRASIGIASLRRGQSPEELVADATRALDRARAAGGGQTAIYSPNGADHGGNGYHRPLRADVVGALASALLERDRYTGDHSEGVVEMAARVAEALALDDAEVGRVRTAALLHDIGKVGIPDEILHKPTPLADREWEIMRQHPAIGERILRAVPGMGHVAKVVRHEHERWDGSGYPDGLAGHEIPIASRIIFACDAYHAMTSNRPYRKAMSHAAAVGELRANAGSQFDADVVEALVGYLYGRRQAGYAAG